MLRALIMAGVLVFGLTAPALADPTALSYSFDWSISSRYSLWDGGFMTATKVIKSQEVNASGHGPLTFTVNPDKSLTLAWGTGSAGSGVAQFESFGSPTVFPTDSFRFTTGLDDRPGAVSSGPNQFGYYVPVGDPFAPESFTLSFVAGEDCLRGVPFNCNYQWESGLFGVASRVNLGGGGGSSVAAPEPGGLALTAAGLLGAIGIRCRRHS